VASRGRGVQGKVTIAAKGAHRVILRNAAVSWLAIATSQVVALVLTPLIIYFLGKETYGVWYLLVSISWLLSSLDLGLSTALVRHVAARLATGDRQGARSFVATCLSLFSMQAVLVALVYLVLFIWLGDIFTIPATQLWPARWVLLCLAVASVLSLPSRIFGGMLVAREHYVVTNLVETAGTVFRFILMLGVLWIGGGLVSVGMVHAAVLLAGYLALAGFALRRVDLGGPVRFGWQGSLAKQAITFGGDTILMNLGERVRNQLPVWLLGMWADPVAVARYGVGVRLTTNQVTLVRQGTEVSRPRYSALEATGEKEALGKLLLRMALYSSLAACYIGGGLVLLAGDFITLWVGPGFELSGAVVRILVGPITLALALYCCDTMLLGIGRHRVIGLVSLGEALVVIALGWPLISRYGVLGGAMASAGALLLVRPWLVPAYTCRIAGLGLGRFWWRGPLKAVVALAPAVGLSFWILSGWPADTWLRLAVVGALYSALCLPGAWFIALDDSERDFWKRMLGDLWERLPRRSPRQDSGDSQDDQG